MSKFNLHDLNDEQRAAVTHEGSPLIVLAGPGTGKTRVITHRVAWLIHERGVEPDSILALTFTNKAAEEMRRRLADLLDSTTMAERVVASTFHSFGLRLLRRMGDLAGLRTEPRLIDGAQQRALMRDIIEETGLGYGREVYDPLAVLPAAIRFLREARNNAIFPDDAARYGQKWSADLEAQSADFSEEDFAAEQTRLTRFNEHTELYDRFEKACIERGWATFDDLQAWPIRFLREHENIRAMARSDYKHIVVDEYQDVNMSQLEFLKCLAGPTHDLCVVGDDDQAIYGFRGAVQSSFSRFVEHWNNTETIELTQNYRSTAIILDAADRIIQQCDDRFHPDKRTIASGKLRDEKVPIEGVTYEQTEGAGAVIGQMILDAVKAEEDANYRGFAVIARTNSDADRIAAALDVLGLPVEMPDRGSTFTHPVVTDILSWLRLLADPHDGAHLNRILTRPPFSIDLVEVAGWGREHRRFSARAEDEGNEAEASRPLVERLMERQDSPAAADFARTYRSLAEFALAAPADDLVLKIIEETGVLSLDPLDPGLRREQVEQLGRFLAFVRERMPALAPPRRVTELLAYMDDLIESGEGFGLSAEDRMDSGIEFSDRDAVRILTAHKSKGLEFDTVFIPRVNARWGYPYGDLSKGDEKLIPDDLRGVERGNHLTEERRVFFVAATRAERRLILLTQIKMKAKRCSPSEYWDEIIVDSSPDLPVVQHSSDDIVSKATDDHRIAIDIAEGLAEAQAQRQREKLAVRHQAFAVLHELHDATLDPALIPTLQKRLTDAIWHLPILAAGDRGQAERIIEAAPSELRDGLSALVDRLEREEPWYAHLPNPQPPLDLSYTDIQMYLDCPRCYWLRRVVRLPEASSSSANFGSIIHRSLELFYNCIRQAESGEGSPPPPPTVENLIQLGRQAYDDIRPPEEAFSKELAERVDEALGKYFQTLHRPSINPIEIEHKIVFDYPKDGHRHRITARMDRVDADGDGFHVIDYKTGRPTKVKLKPSGTDLQLGIYHMALQHWADDEDVAGMGEYWLTSSGEKGVLPFEKVKVDKIRGKIDHAIDGILSGDWTPGPRCTRCELTAEVLDGVE